MDAQSYTAQERRAANQVWAAAGAYGFERRAGDYDVSRNGWVMDYNEPST